MSSSLPVIHGARLGVRMSAKTTSATAGQIGGGTMFGSTRRRFLAAVTALSTAAAGVVVAIAGLATPAYAAPGTDASAPVAHDRVVSAVPASWTPQIKDGRVFAITQVGTTMVVGGSFTQVSPSSGSPNSARQRIMAFNATNGAISSTFNPTINGDVNAVAPGPTSGTVYVAGSFSTVNGVTAKVALLNVSNGATVTSFRAPGINGAVNDIVRYGNRLYVAGTFTTVGGTTKRGLTTLNATTGALDPFMNVQLTENHNWTPGGGGAQGPVGAKAIAVNQAGTKLVVIGNFRKADDQTRRQVAMINITGGAAAVALDWRTDRYQDACFNWAFDSWIRDVDFAPDGSYFVIAGTGGPNPGTLCDTVARWETNATGQAVQPVWIDDTGGDTLASVSTSGAAVYTGGHQRWHNNAGGTDRASQGAVPRPGMAATDPRSGVPLSWNPGRHPRGVAAFVMQPTAAGLWVGSDTTYIGNFQYWRPRLAFFPLAGGTQYGPGATGDLPSNVYLADAGATAPTGGTVLHRVNTGGPAVSSIDGGPDWLADDGADECAAQLWQQRRRMVASS